MATNVKIDEPNDSFEWSSRDEVERLEIALSRW